MNSDTIFIIFFAFIVLFTSIFIYTIYNESQQRNNYIRCMISMGYEEATERTVLYPEEEWHSDFIKAHIKCKKETGHYQEIWYQGKQH